MRKIDRLDKTGEDPCGVDPYAEKDRRYKSQRTLDMNRPKAPPSAKPIPPAMMDFTRHDSMPDCICEGRLVLGQSHQMVKLAHHLDIFLLLLTHPTRARLGAHPGIVHPVILPMGVKRSAEESSKLESMEIYGRRLQPDVQVM